MQRHSVPNSLLLEWLFLHVQNRQDYIHFRAKASYRDWWERTTKDVWFSCNLMKAGDPSAQEICKRLYPHLYPEKRAKRRYSYDRTRYQDHRPMVSHTVVYPDGTEETYEWKSIHGNQTWKWGGPSRYSSKVTKHDRFRQRLPKGVKAERGRKADSFDRAEKTKSFRRNDKYTSAWPMSCGAKRSAQIEDNRKFRREARRLIRDGRWDEVATQMPPTDTWKWD